MIETYCLYVWLVLSLILTTTQTACVSIQDCSNALKFIEKNKNGAITRNILKRAHCGVTVLNGHRYALVHCDKIPPFEDFYRPQAEACGVQSTSYKIAGGDRAEFEDFPWLALLQYKNQTHHLRYRCHGTLINNRYVLTAAHCLQFNTAKKKKDGTLYKIILGEYDIRNETDCVNHKDLKYCMEPVQKFSPETIHIHPDFLSQKGRSDIALIRLDKTVNFSDYVKPICLPTGKISLKFNHLLWIAGWGNTETGKFSNYKLKAQLQYLPMENCERFDIDQTEICAGSLNNKTTDTCRGDSGGPLTFLQKYSNGDLNSVLVGIVSLGKECGFGLGVYTNVSYFMPWILNKMHNDE